MGEPECDPGIEAVIKLRRIFWTLATIALILGMLVLPRMIPASVFMVADIAFIPAETKLPGGEKVIERDSVVQTRDPAWPMEMRWQAAVYRSTMRKANGDRQWFERSVVCHGKGVWTYKPGAPPTIMPLTHWVGDRNCALNDGIYRLYAQWTYRFLIWSWTVDAASEPFTIEGRG